MASARTSQPRKKKGGNLDIDDMERRIVEFRLMLDREKRRCQAAKMADKFEQLIRDKLSELNQETGTTGAAEADHAIHLQTLDTEAFGRLSNFLRYTVDKCSRSDQHEQFQTVLRNALLSARRKITLDIMQDPATATRPLLEPFCFFCAGNINTTCTSCGQANGAPEGIGAPAGQPQAENGQREPGLFGLTPVGHLPSNTDVPADRMYTPAPTPEVGEQARSNGGRASAGAASGHGAGYKQPQVEQPQKEVVRAQQPAPTLNDLQSQFNQSFTRQSNASQSQTTRVPPSDDSNESADDSGASADEMRGCLADVHKRVEAMLRTSQRGEGSQLGRSSTPLSEAGDLEGGLIIDEDAANRSQEEAATGRAPSPIASSSPLTRVKVHVSSGKGSKGLKESSPGHAAGIKFKSSAVSSTVSSTGSSSSSRSNGKGIQLEQLSERLRSGKTPVRRKFQPKRRNNNDNRN